MSTYNKNIYTKSDWQPDLASKKIENILESFEKEIRSEEN